MQYFGFNRRSGISRIALSVGLALTMAHGAGAQSVALTQVTAQPTVTPEFVDAVRQTLTENPEILLEVFAVLEAQQEAQETNNDRMLIADHADTLFDGLDLDKPILIEFQDYNCGYCRRVHADVKALRDRSPDLQLVVLEFPILGENSKYTAEIALAVKALYGETTYRDFVDAAMGLDSPANPATVLHILNDMGLDGQAVTQSAKSPDIAAELKRAAYLARTMGIQGTPAFIGPSGITRGAAGRTQLAALSQPAAETTASNED